VLFSVKTGPATYRMVLAGTLRVPERAGRAPQGYRPFAEAYVRLLEACVREHPFQFFNFYDMWAVPGDVSREGNPRGRRG
jgi:predicted LPLAT superfamily acyltransferase